MPNLTMTVDRDLLRKARQQARARHMSLNALVRQYLAELAAELEEAQPGDREARAAELLALFEQEPVNVGPRCWTRQELHERQSLR